MGHCCLFNSERNLEQKFGTFSCPQFRTKARDSPRTAQKIRLCPDEARLKNRVPEVFYFEWVFTALAGEKFSLVYNEFAENFQRLQLPQCKTRL